MTAASATPDESERRRGRPTVIDAEQLLHATLSLWRDRGYQETGWREIAEVTGVSVRTLIRRFGERSRIPWVGLPAAVARLEGALAIAPQAAPLGAVVRNAIVASVSHEDGVLRLSPDWISLVSEVPQLRASAPIANAAWVDALARFIADRHPDAPAAACRALAVAYEAATFSALVQWARAGAEGAPDRAVGDMLAWLDIRLQSPRRYS
ncbi:TetR/AcrR family transcriptional regulator [Salinibacterium sp. UTAS2018]|uniref:TetR/AcrR family transcriptional regulator n=1 Tax=Salinibacterium sp. UTAS2018 TaxID=2508880 RepID=UPI00143DCEEA|nr:helix-turn-helix domain-containing protein [Salinibacterium sp. UTAS2018]